MSNNDVIINATKLTKYYGKQIGIDGVDLEVKRVKSSVTSALTALGKPRPSALCWTLSDRPAVRRLFSDLDITAKQC